MDSAPNKPIDVSVIVTIPEYSEDLEKIYQDFSKKLAAMNKSFEFIFVQCMDSSKLFDALSGLHKRYTNLKVIRLRSSLSESDALSIGFQKAEGRYILTLPVYFQISSEDIDKLILPLEEKLDLTAAWRYPRADTFLNRIESKIFNWLARKLTGIETHDLGCGVMAMKKEVALSIDIYGDLFRFIPLLAYQQGYRIGEIKIPHIKRRKKSGFYGIGVYSRRLLDILTLFFLVKFTKKPLRFFGLIGFGVFGAGTAINMWLTIQRTMGKALADRPMLILGVLLMVLGIQLFSIGLIGEIIIFTHAQKVKEYRIEEILG